MFKLPISVTKYFWGDELANLNWERNRDYITKTILEKGDMESVKWLIENVDRGYLKQVVKEKKLDQKSKIFWSLYL